MRETLIAETVLEFFKEFAPRLKDDYILFMRSKLICFICGGDMRVKCVSTSSCCMECYGRICGGSTVLTTYGFELGGDLPEVR